MEFKYNDDTRFLTTNCSFNVCGTETVLEVGKLYTYCSILNKFLTATKK